MNFSRSLDVVAEPDVLVVGAGCAGTVAAIAAARQGADTMVVERTGFAGGYITNVVGASLDGFVDLRSGSCGMAALSTCRDRARREVISGVNLPMLLDFVFHRDMPLEELTARVIERGRTAIGQPGVPTAP